MKIEPIALFQGINDCHRDVLLSCLQAVQVTYKKGATVVAYGSKADFIGVLLKGSVQILKDDYTGNRNIVAHIRQGDLFGEAFSCGGKSFFPVNVTAQEDCEILYIKCEQLTTSCKENCSFHTKLIQNLLHIISKKNIALTEKIEYLSKRTTREKLLSYLYAESLKSQEKEFSIPFNRQELADYLCVDRSAMSWELSKMQKEGLFRYRKNRFCLK